MRYLIACLLLILTLPALAFGPTPPGVAVVGGNSVVVKYSQNQYGTSSEVNLYVDLQRNPIVTISNVTGGVATFSNVRPGIYVVTVVSEQSRIGSGANVLVP